MRLGPAWLAGLLLVAGCGSGDEPPGSELWPDGVAAAAPSVDLGAGCALPVRLSIPRGWQATPVPAGTFDVAGASLTCEISVHPTSHVGYVRIYVDRGDDSPADFLHAYAEAQKAVQPQVRELAPGAELSYLTGHDNTVLRHWVFAIRAENSVVAITLDPFGKNEYAELTPAYVLAKETARPE